MFEKLRYYLGPLNGMKASNTRTEQVKLFHCSLALLEEEDQIQPIQNIIPQVDRKNE